MTARETRTDVKIMSFVRAFRLAYRRGPTLREIALELGATTKTSVSRAVNRLVAAGRLVKMIDGLAVPGDVEAAVVMLRKQGWQILEPKRNPT